MLGPLVDAARGDVRSHFESLAGLAAPAAPLRGGVIGGFVRLVRGVLKKCLNPWFDAQTRFNRRALDALESTARALDGQYRFNCDAIDTLERTLWALQGHILQVRSELQSAAQALTNCVHDAARAQQAEREEHEERLNRAVGTLSEQTEAALESLEARMRQAGLSFRPAVAVELAEDGAAVARVSERILESIFVHSRLPAPPARVLALGCGDRTSALEMASLGFQVIGLASPPHPLRHPNLQTVQAAGAGLPFPDGTFDVVVSLSNVEGDVANVAVPGSAERKASTEAARVLRPGGRLLLTVPYGKAGASPRRVFDPAALAEWLRPFRVVEKGFGLRTGEVWAYSADERRAGEADSRDRVSALALVAAERP
jgi:SAM-dependent methyltransferase